MLGRGEADATAGTGKGVLRWPCTAGVAYCRPCCSTCGGGDLVPCVFSMQDISLRQTTDPHILPGGPGSEHPC